MILFFHVRIYGDSYVGHKNLSNSLVQSNDLCPTGSSMLFHNAFAAVNIHNTILKYSHQYYIMFHYILDQI